MRARNCSQANMGEELEGGYFAVATGYETSVESFEWISDAYLFSILPDDLDQWI